MRSCFQLLGLLKTATKEQIMEAYEPKKALYTGSAFDEDSKYAKRKLIELKEAVQEAWSVVEKREGSVLLFWIVIVADILLLGALL